MRSQPPKRKGKFELESFIDRTSTDSNCILIGKAKVPQSTTYNVNEQSPYKFKMRMH